MTETPEKFSESTRSRSDLVHSASGKILLAIEWTHGEARRKFDRFPELMGGDDTEQTNSEERPLCTLCVEDSSNKTYAHTWCFMPSKGQWTMLLGMCYLIHLFIPKWWWFQAIIWIPFFPLIVLSFFIINTIIP